MSEPSPFYQPTLDGMEEYLEKWNKSSALPEPEPQKKEANFDQVHFYLTEAQYGVERLASQISNELRGELADVLFNIENAQNELGK